MVMKGFGWIECGTAAVVRTKGRDYYFAWPVPHGGTDGIGDSDEIGVVDDHGYTQI